MLGLMKANGFVALPNILHINLQQCHNLCQWVDKSPFNPFDIKCNLMWKTSENLNLMWKSSENVFLGLLGEWMFHIW